MMATAAAGGQYLTFKVGSEVFGLDIATVQEVLDFTGTVAIPNAPEYLRGVIDLRGKAVPVVDLRRVLHADPDDGARGERACVIIIETVVDGEVTRVGALADAVREVVRLEPGDVEPSPRIGRRLNLEFIRGLGKRDGRFVLLLDFDRVFADGGITLAVEAATA